MNKLSRRLTRIAASVFALGVTVVATVWVFRGLEARKMPDLQVWHTYEAQNEFRARDYQDGITFAEYHELEDRLFAEIDEHVYGAVVADGGMTVIDMNVNRPGPGQGEALEESAGAFVGTRLIGGLGFGFFLRNELSILARHERIDIFNEDGGFVFNAIHNLQANSPVENMLAMLKAVKDSRNA